MLKLHARTDTKVGWFLHITTCEKKIGLLLIEVFRRSLIHMIMATWQRVAIYYLSGKLNSWFCLQPL
jgi:hypothetical protein